MPVGLNNTSGHRSLPSEPYRVFYAGLEKWIQQFPKAVQNKSRLVAHEIECAFLKKSEILNIHFPIDSLPEEIFYLVNLKEINLDALGISVLPDGIAKLVNLEVLNLDKNNIDFLPESLCNLPNLRNLSLRENRLFALPENFPQLKNLVELDLTGNKFVFRPEGIGHIRDVSGIDHLVRSIAEEVVYAKDHVLDFSFSINGLAKIKILLDYAVSQASKDVMWGQINRCFVDQILSAATKLWGGVHEELEIKKQAALLKDLCVDFVSNSPDMDENNDIDEHRKLRISVRRADSIQEFVANDLNGLLLGIDKNIRQKIKSAYAYLGALDLLRENRPDISNFINHHHGYEYVDISDIREKINNKFNGKVHTYKTESVSLSKLKDSMIDARASKEVYEEIISGDQSKHYAAYCGEHSALLLNKLIEKGFSLENMRPFTISANLISIDDEVNHSFIVFYSDKYDFEKSLYENSGNVFFLNPWGVNKIISFAADAGKKGIWNAFEEMMLEVDSDVDLRTLKMQDDGFFMD